MATTDLHLTQAEKESILAGRGYVFKDAPYGRAWDTFTIDGKRFEIIDVCERPWSTIARGYDTISRHGIPAGDVQGKDRPGSPEHGPSVFIHWFRKIESN